MTVVTTVPQIIRLDSGRELVICTFATIVGAIQTASCLLASHAHRTALDWSLPAANERFPAIVGLFSPPDAIKPTVIASNIASQRNQAERATSLTSRFVRWSCVYWSTCSAKYWDNAALVVPWLSF